MPSRNLLSHPQPIHDFDEATREIAAMQYMENDSIWPECRTKFYSHGKRTHTAVLLLHGYTAGTQQFAPLAERCFDEGYNVFIPRVPHHGKKDRASTETKKLTSVELARFSDHVMDIVCGLGERVIVGGLSMGGVLTAWLAQQRTEVDKALIIAPIFAVHFIPVSIFCLAARLVLLLPDWMHWWDAKKKDKGDGLKWYYARFSMHGLAHIIRLGCVMRALAHRQLSAAREIWLVLNDNDESVDSATVRKLSAAWKISSSGRFHTYTFPRSDGLPHDLIVADDEHGEKNVRIAYPQIMKIVKGP